MLVVQNVKRRSEHYEEKYRAKAQRFGMVTRCGHVSRARVAGTCCGHVLLARATVTLLQSRVTVTSCGHVLQSRV